MTLDPAAQLALAAGIVGAFFACFALIRVWVFAKAILS